MANISRFLSVFFTCIVRVMYNLLYYQVVVQLCTTLTELECSEIVAKYSTANGVPIPGTTTTPNSGPSRGDEGQGVYNLGMAMAFVLNQTNMCRHLRRECLDEEKPNRFNLQSMELQLQKLCLPFLRIASLLRHHLYHQELPEVTTPPLEFVRLVYFLELVTNGMEWSEFNGTKALCFLPGTEFTLPLKWCEELMETRPPTDSIRELIINQHVTWFQPKLLGLPREYERLFTVSYTQFFIIHFFVLHKYKLNFDSSLVLS